MKRLSIRKQLITLFVPFLFGLWITSAIVSFWLVSTFSGESFDRDLISSADSVVGRLRMKEGKVVVDLPPGRAGHSQTPRIRQVLLPSCRPVRTVDIR